MNQVNDKIILIVCLVFFMLINIHIYMKYEKSFGYESAKPIKRIIVFFCLLCTFACGYVFSEILN